MLGGGHPVVLGANAPSHPSSTGELAEPLVKKPSRRSPHRADAAADRPRTSTQASVPVVRATRALTAEAVWAQLRSRPAAERPALMRGYLQQLAPREVARLLELSEAGARDDVLKRLARPEGLCQR